MKLPIDVLNEVQFVGDDQMVTSDCYAITFKRVEGANPVFINGFPLGDGESLQIEETVNHLDRTQYQIRFGTGGTGNSCYVFRTVPVNDYFRD